MSRLLGIQWGDRRLRVVEATVRGGQATIERAFVWDEDVRPNPAQAEEAGKRLQARLREAGIRSAPVRYLLERDHVILREVSYPHVPEAEVTALVQFQVAKELSFPADEGVIDYLPHGVTGAMGEQRALAAVIHKDLYAAILKSCQVAGLRLAGVTALPFALLADWQNRCKHQPDLAQSTCAVLLRCKRGIEFCVIRGSDLLFSRFFNTPESGTLVPELRRSLAAFAGQFPQQPITRLILCGGEWSEEKDRLAAVLKVPVTVLEASAAFPNISSQQRAEFNGLAELLQARTLPVNFAAPRKVPPPPSKTRYYTYGAAAAVLFIALAVLWYWTESTWREDQLDELRSRKALLDKQIKALGDVDKRLEAINNWAGNEIVLLDELYELAARFPDQPGLRITKVTWAPPPATLTQQQPQTRPGTAARPVVNAGSKPAGRLIIEATGDAQRLEQLHAALKSAPHWKLEQPEIGSGQARFTLRVFRQEPHEYDTILDQPVHLTTGMTPRDNRRDNERGGRP